MYIPAWSLQFLNSGLSLCGSYAINYNYPSPQVPFLNISGARGGDRMDKKLLLKLIGRLLHVMLWTSSVLDQ